MTTLSPAEAIVHWCREREAIRLKREIEEVAPWTDDPILAKYRFCNVRREDDRVTVWIRKNIRHRFADHPHLWFMLAISRWINWPPTLEFLINDEDGAWPDRPRFTPELLALALHFYAGSGRKVFTGAYTINAPAEKGGSKIDYVSCQVLGDVWWARMRIADILTGEIGAPTLRAAHAELTRYRGWGAFMAYQVVVDLRFARYLHGAEDVSKWAAAGPGTIRGLNRLAGRKTDRPLEQWRALTEMRKLYEYIPLETGVEMDFSDVPNILCETDKYLRVLNGEGAPRALYHPT